MKANIAVKLLSFLSTNNGKPKGVHQEKIRLIVTGALAKLKALMHVVVVPLPTNAPAQVARFGHRDYTLSAQYI